MSVAYLDRGLILEQAVAWECEKFLREIGFDELYSNFHVHVTNSHPFAQLYIEGGTISSDTFPCVVITSADSRKPDQLAGMPQQVRECTIDADDVEALFATGNPGTCTIASDEVKAALLEWIAASDTGEVNATAVQTYRSDRVSFEIWSENAQLKNELFEHLRLFVASNLIACLRRDYPIFGINAADGRIGETRSNNYNMDFGVTLHGGQITHQIDYVIEQVRVESEASTFDADNLEWSAQNLVKTAEASV